MPCFELGFEETGRTELYVHQVRETLAKLTTHELVRQAGAQGAEFILWLAMRGALCGRVSKLHSNYHIPISNTASGILLLDNQPLRAAA